MTTEATPLLESSEQPQDDVPDSNRSGSLALLTTISPMVVRIPASTFIALTFFSAFPVVLYIVGFTEMGYGFGVFDFLSAHVEKYSIDLGMSILGYAFVLYLFDCQFWSSTIGKWCRCLNLLILMVATGILLLMIAGMQPYGPMIDFLVLTTTWMVIIRTIFYRNVPTKEYISWLSGPFLLLSLLSFLVWFVWIFYKDENEWTVEINAYEAQTVGCDPDFVTYPECLDPATGGVCFNYTTNNEPDFSEGCPTVCEDVYDACPNLFVLWAGPMLVSTGMLCLAFFCSFMRGGDLEHEIMRFVKIWLALLFLIWVSASLAGVVAGLTSSLLALCGACFLSSAIFLTVSFNQAEQEEQLNAMWEKFEHQYGAWMDVLRGLLVVTCSPVFLVYLLASVLVQGIRNCTCFACSKPPEQSTSMRDVVGNHIFTVEARKVIREVQSWDTTKVAICAIYWGLAYMVLSVLVSKFTILFLSWLIEVTSVFSLGVVTGILIGVGFIMFMLPPVPGVPIYLTLGIVIIAVGRDTIGIVGSMAYALMVSLFLKLFACTVQQKIIGGFCQGFVGVRQLVAINSKPMRAMRLVLSEPGLGMAKVCILVGGPDWPTSVLCGIMDLALFPILFGTLPIIFLIIPTMLTGSFSYMSGLTLADGTLEYTWASTATTITTAVTAMIQFSSMVGAAYYLEQTASTRGEELEAIPIDEEVKALDDKLEVVNQAYLELRNWEILPTWSKFVLGTSLASIVVSSYLVSFLGTQCFASYDVTYTITENLDGDWKNFVLPLGWVVIGLFLLSSVLLQVFNSWVSSKAARAVRNEDITV